MGVLTRIVRHFALPVANEVSGRWHLVGTGSRWECQAWGTNTRIYLQGIVRSWHCVTSSFTRNYLFSSVYFTFSRTKCKKIWRSVSLSINMSLFLWDVYQSRSVCHWLEVELVFSMPARLWLPSVSLQHTALIKPPFPLITFSTDHAYIQKHISDLFHFFSLSACL